MAQLRKLTSYDKNAMGKRRETIERYGYDLKNATHLIRLMRMGIEILLEGNVIVYRPDRKELLEIRQGLYTLKDIQEEYERLNERLNDAYKKFKLPDEPNYHKINNWLVNIHKRSLNWRGI